MPGVVSSVAVAVGELVIAGQPLLTLEAMKMETTIRAPVGGSVTEILIGAGVQVAAKDLLIVVS